MTLRCACAVLALCGSVAWAGNKPDLGANASLHGKQVFAASSAWNQDVSNAPIDPNSQALIASIGAERGLHPDFGTGITGIPYIVVGGNQAKVAIEFAAYGNESDKGPYPVPADAPVEGGPASKGDRHVLVLDRDNWILYELYNSWLQPDGHWRCDSAATWNLQGDPRRPAGWTSADAAGLPIFPGLVRYDEVSSAQGIAHALRFTIVRSRAAYVDPATHWASSHRDANLPPMGMRVRLRGDYDITPFGQPERVILTALKRYGMIVADNGSNWYISGAPDPRWNDDELHNLGRVKGKDFLVVRMDNVVSR